VLSHISSLASLLTLRPSPLALTPETQSCQRRVRPKALEGRDRLEFSQIQPFDQATWGGFDDPENDLEGGNSSAGGSIRLLSLIPS
jgi:hypothetical protein